MTPEQVDEFGSAQDQVQPSMRLTLVTLVVLAAVPAINYAWLAVLGVDYFGLYLQSGFIVALLFGVVTVAIDLDTLPGLIAAHPRYYVKAVGVLAAVEYFALSTAIQPRRRPGGELRTAGLVPFTSSVPVLDFVFETVFVLGFAAALFAWVMLVAPLQYWLNIVCGAPARGGLTSSKTVWVQRSVRDMAFIGGPKNPNKLPEPYQTAYERGELTEVAFATKPVTLTAAIAAACLFGASRLA